MIHPPRSVRKLGRPETLRTSDTCGCVGQPVEARSVASRASASFLTPLPRAAPMRSLSLVGQRDAPGRPLREAVRSSIREGEEKTVHDAETGKGVLVRAGRPRRDPKPSLGEEHSLSEITRRHTSSDGERGFSRVSRILPIDQITRSRPMAPNISIRFGKRCLRARPLTGNCRTRSLHPIRRG
jgi:hypothetical protein